MYNIREVFNSIDGYSITKVVGALDAGMNVNARDQSGQTLLMRAAASRNTELMSVLLARGADVNAQEYSRRMSTLMQEVLHGSKAGVKLLLEHNANPNLQNSQGRTALMFAASDGYLDIMKLLLAKNSDIDAQNEDGMTALMFAVDNQQTDAVRYLLEHDANFEATNSAGNTAMDIAENGHNEEIQAMLQEKMDERRGPAILK